MKLRVVIIQCAILCAVLAGGRAHAADSDRASLAGRIVKEPGGEPLKKALVELIQETTGESTHNYTATSDAEGNFEIRQIVPGRYHVLIERTGYIFVDAKRHRSDAAALSFEHGQALTDQVFRMLPCAVLTGHVLDEDGDAMPDAFVAVLRSQPVAGHLDQIAGERANDVGQYRISGIMPGRYYVSVTPPPDIANLLSPHKKDAKPDLAYVPTFYPNAIDHSQASVLELRPGDELPIDFSLARTPTARIRGTVASLAVGSHTSVVLHSTDGNVMFNQVEVDRDGKFEMRDVAPGSYDLLAIETLDDKTRVARQTEQVAGTNIEGVQLTPVPGATVRGRLRIDGPPADLSQFVLTLQPTEADNWVGTLMSSGLGRVHPDGSFEWKDVPPGTYYLVAAAEQTSGSSYFLESVNAGGHDTRDAGLTISGGSLFLDAVLNPKGAKLEGVVTDDKDQPVANALVVAVPEERFRKRPERYTKCATDQRGRFSMQGLIPGQYSLFAWETLDDPEAVNDPSFLKPYEEHAVAVTLDKTGQAPVSLKVLPAPED